MRASGGEFHPRNIGRWVGSDKGALQPPTEQKLPVGRIQRTLTPASATSLEDLCCGSCSVWR